MVHGLIQTKKCFWSLVLNGSSLIVWAPLAYAQSTEAPSLPLAPAAASSTVNLSDTGAGPHETAPSTMGTAPPAMENKSAMPPEGTKVHWYENFKYEAFVDTYASVNYNVPKPQSPVAPLGFQGGNQFRAYDVSNGFALHWFGLDISHIPDPVGGGLNLRMGPGATLFNAPGSPDSNPANGLQYIKNAYVNWKPAGKDSKVTLTMGKFNQPFGSEVPESQYNMNYTRSLLYWYAQPLFLTGFKADFAATDQLLISLFAVNGWNTSQDGNLGKTGALQFNWMPTPEFMAVLGYAVGPEQSDINVIHTGAGASSAVTVDNNGDASDANSRLRHFIDLVLDIRLLKELRFLVNADYGREKPPPSANNLAKYEWYGANLAIGYTFSENFAASVRGEWYKDPQGFTTLTGKDTTLYDGTLTLTAMPTSNLIIKIENRLDSANEPLFQKKLAETSKTQFTTTLGVVATSGM